MHRALKSCLRWRAADRRPLLARLGVTDVRHVLRLGAVLLTLIVSESRPCTADSGLGPQGVVRRFCQLDGLGRRVATRSWFEISELVEWPLEPVWDHAVLVSGYEVGPPLAVDLDLMQVEIRYAVIGQISPNGDADQAYIDRVVLRVRPDQNGNWRIVGPPPSPHLFVSRIDVAAARRVLEPGQSNYPTNSDFIWQMFRAAGWDIDYETLAQLSGGRNFGSVASPKPGDVVLYLRDGVAYHGGILDDETHLTSATINGGVMRTALDMFDGEVVYLRLLEPLPTNTPEATRVEDSPTPLPSPTPRATATPKVKEKKPAAVQRKPAPKAKRAKKPAAKSKPDKVRPKAPAQASRKPKA